MLPRTPALTATAAAAAAAAVTGRSVAVTRDPGREDEDGAAARVPAPRAVHRVPTTGGASLHVVEWGQARGRPVVLAHGYTATHGDWLPVVPGLLAAGRRVLALDLPGHGRSSRGRGRLDVGRLADAVQAVLEHLDLRDAVLGGHSLGGTAALALAARDPARAAERVRALVTVAAPPQFRRPPEVGTIAFGASPLTPALLDARASGRLLVRLQIVGPGAAPEVVDAVRRRWSACPLPTRWACARGVLGADLRPLLPAVPVPVTAVAGGADRICPPSRAHLIADRVPRGRAVVLDGAGHATPLERPAEVTAALLEAAG
ncbi:alpha/beta fold hydrolase [Quadrisphaera sp. DSM 44207]|uniref:alpha/beta fold hydrolase n=1 Tax=Quadrisphaera sp. DSM 44207 TaxID=1881057 RepID=UPI00115FDD4D|nr:alpha/beta fold hydrolase [Quadrisphaera sp. DSM 44207]